jgi:hypothetical protein
LPFKISLGPDPNHVFSPPGPLFSRGSRWIFFKGDQNGFRDLVISTRGFHGRFEHFLFERLLSQELLKALRRRRGAFFIYEGIR